ncbi:hypothetical protein [Paenibacillus ginsengihumi]|uniref:hypothetical protein n=1 Tax=Paenibacillus ginsengihumi TaxID=431596 RepID=UPI00037209C9|nr:hypothetical protein [Paenibacillus ginsengihumi]
MWSTGDWPDPQSRKHWDGHPYRRAAGGAQPFRGRSGWLFLKEMNAGMDDMLALADKIKQLYGAYKEFEPIIRNVITKSVQQEEPLEEELLPRREGSRRGKKTKKPIRRF